MDTQQAGPPVPPAPLPRQPPKPKEPLDTTSLVLSIVSLVLAFASWFLMLHIFTAIPSVACAGVVIWRVRKKLQVTENIISLVLAVFGLALSLFDIVMFAIGMVFMIIYFVFVVGLTGVAMFMGAS